MLHFSADGTKNILGDFFSSRMTSLVTSGGEVDNYHFLHLVTRCQIDITYFPWDTQSCAIVIGSWAYDMRLLQMYANETDDWMFGPYSNNNQWNVLKLWVEHRPLLFSGRVYMDVVFHIDLRRHPIYHVIHVVLPLILLHATTLASILVPPEGGERVSVGVTSFLSYFVFCVILADIVPESSMSTPLICEY